MAALVLVWLFEDFDRLIDISRGAYGQPIDRSRAVHEETAIVVESETV